MPDRIEAGTYAIAAAIAGGEVELVGARHETIAALLDAAGARPAPRSRDTPRGHEGAHQWRPADMPCDRYHRALSGLSHRSAGPVHGADDGGRRHRGDPRDHFRKPLHACAGTGAAWARHPHRRRHRHRARRGKTQGRAGDGDRSARLCQSWCWRAWRRKAKPSSIASIISIAVSTGWKKSFRGVGADIARIPE